LGGLERFEDEVCGCENLVFIACGSSYYSAMSVLPIFRALRIFETVTITEGSEFTLNDLP
jgi:fructoselysine-6-P-deglycase FrlB-like protein